MPNQGYPIQQYTNLDNDIVLSVASDGTITLINGTTMANGAGSPEGVVTAPPGSWYIQTDAVAPDFWWQKQTGTGNTGWTVIGAGGVNLVTSVFGRAGVVVADANDYSNVPDLLFGDGVNSISFDTGASKLILTSPIISMPDGFIDASAAGLNVKGGPAFSNLVVTDGSVSLTDAHFNGMTTNGVTDTVQVSDAGGDTLLFAGGKIQSTVLIEAPSAQLTTSFDVGNEASLPAFLQGYVSAVSLISSLVAPALGIEVASAAGEAVYVATLGCNGVEADVYLTGGLSGKTVVGFYGYSAPQNNTVLAGTLYGCAGEADNSAGAALTKAAAVQGVVTLNGVGTITKASSFEALNSGIASKGTGVATGVGLDVVAVRADPTTGTAIGVWIENSLLAANIFAIKSDVASPSLFAGPLRTTALRATALQIHANNAAALGAGLVVGDFYRTGADPDVVCVVH